MRRAFVLIAVLVVAMALSVAGRAAARTPTQTPTATPWPTSTPTSTPTPTIPPDQMAVFRARVWLDAHLTGAHIVARIGETECGESVPVALVCDPISCGPVVDVEIVSNNIKSGCGFDGAEVAFFVDGKEASQKVVWHAGRNAFLDLVVGLPFANVRGTFPWPGKLPGLDLNSDESQSVVVPYVGDKACGYNYILTGVWGTTGWIEGEYDYRLVVYSNEQRPGCGYEGVPITFKLSDGHGNVLATAEERGVWHAWDGTAATAEELNLTLVTPSGIRIGSVGTGDSKSATWPAAAIALELAIAGLATLGAGTVLRKRAGR